MTPERVACIREKIAAAKAKGATSTTTVDIMVLTLGELEELIDAEDQRLFTLAIAEQRRHIV